MSKKSLNPLIMGLGLAVGAAGAVLLSKKENRVKAVKIAKRLKTKGPGILDQFFTLTKKAIGELSVLNDQPGIDQPKKKKSSPTQ